MKDPLFTPKQRLESALKTKMFFGKYNGVPLYQIPTDYLEWYMKNGRDVVLVGRCVLVVNSRKDKADTKETIG
jgi:uncharacterized protein (DUF3820 family)